MKLTQHFFPSNSKFRRFWTSIFTNSYNFLHLAQIFGIFKQKQLNLSLNQTKYWPNWPNFCSNSAKFQPNSSKFLSNSAKFSSNSEFRRVSRRNRRKNPQKKHCVYGKGSKGVRDFWNRRPDLLKKRANLDFFFEEIANLHAN